MVEFETGARTDVSSHCESSCEHISSDQLCFNHCKTSVTAMSPSNQGKLCFHFGGHYYITGRSARSVRAAELFKKTETNVEVQHCLCATSLILVIHVIFLHLSLCHSKQELSRRKNLSATRCLRRSKPSRRRRRPWLSTMRRRRNFSPTNCQGNSCKWVMATR